MVSMLLLAVMLLSALPAEAFAADDGSGETALAWKKLGGSEQKAGTGVTGKNYYILEVSTGTIRNGGAADNVVYFNLHYTTTDRKKHSTVLMPKLDALSNGYEIAASAGNREARRNSVNELFSYSTAPLYAKQTLRSVSTDQFLFEAPHEISSIDKIQIFGQHTLSEVTWSCQSLRVFRVDRLYGLEMYGWYSDTGYIDFDGEIICDMDMGTTGGNFKWRTSGGSFNIVKYGDTGGLSDCVLVNKSQKGSYKGNSRAGEAYSSQVANRIVLAMDLADQAGAGFENLAPYYECGSNPSIAMLKLSETAAFTVRYIDLWGDVREITLPFVINAVGQLNEILNSPHIAGYAQQGDSTAVPLMLPAFKQIVNVSVTIGKESVEQKTGLQMTGTATDPVFAKRLDRSNAEEIRYLNFSIYEHASEAEIALDGATVRYRYNETPVSASVATSADGLRVSAGTETYFYLQQYSDTMVLKPKTTGDRYLITLYTDNVENAGTTSDIQMEFSYIDLTGKARTSQPFMVRDYVRQFYGEWPGNVEDFAYNYGFSQAGKVRFMIPLPEVSSFTGVSYKLTGGDEWQVKGCQVQYVESFDIREGKFVETASKDRDLDDPNQARFLSHLLYTRNVTAHKICFSAGAISGDLDKNPDYDITEDPEANPNSDTWVPGDLIQDDGEWKGSNADGTEVITKDDVDWSKLINGMTYEDAQRDLGFTKQRRIYTVHVKVGSDKVTSINDDCGSANLFYFQLIFEHGNSGIVLANQQIDGDAFRTSADVYFDIPTVIDYGELSSIMIIPDNQDSNSNIYDKMKISYIEVMQNTDAALVPTWKFESDNEDGLGWVGIEYHDSAEVGTIKGAEGHSAAEISTTYNVTSSTYSAKLQINITTGAYQRNVGLDADGNPRYEECQQFVGGLRRDYSYVDAKGSVGRADGLDVVYLMDQYAGRTSSYNRTYDDGLRQTEVNYAVSNPQYHFRAGRTDSFFITVSDITKIVDMTLYVRSDRSTTWTITNVSVHLVNGTGRRYLNAEGEYAYRYGDGEKLTMITEWNADTMETLLQVFGGKSDDNAHNNYSGVQPINISFIDAPIQTNKDTNTWSPVVAREPKSKNDTLNLFIYPATREKAADPSTYYLTAGILYKDAMTLETSQAGAGTLDFAYDLSGQPYFYKLGIGAKNLEDIMGVSVKTKSTGTLSAPISYGILQRVRSGVLIETYYLSGVLNADQKSTMSVSVNAKPDAGVQRIMMQVQANNPTQDLIALDRDMALAVYFTPAGATDQELRSKYIYLTDAGYTQIRPGQILELDFDLGDISSINGVNVVKTGTLDLGFENVYIATQKIDGTVIRELSIDDGFTPTGTPARFNPRGRSEVLTLKIKTGQATASSSGGTDDPVRMTIGYYDLYGAEQSWLIPDIRPYIQLNDEKDKPLQAGQTDTLKVIIPAFESLRYVTLEPYNADSGSIASWTLDSITAVNGLEGSTIGREVNKTIVEEDPKTVFLGDIVLVGNNLVYKSKEVPTDNEPVLMVKTSETGTERKANGISIKSGEIGTLSVDSGATVETDIRISGTSQGITYRFVAMDPAGTVESPADFTKGTYSYTEQELDEYYALALKSVGPDVTNQAEIDAGKAVIAEINAIRASKGSFTVEVTEEKPTGFTLVTPRNFTDHKLRYRLVVTAVENEEVGFTLDTLIGNETDKLPQLISDWEKVRSLADLSVINTDGVTEETRTLLKTDTSGVLLDSGESVKVAPRVGASEGFTAQLNSYDPATQAKGRAETGVRHSYSEDTILAYETKANTLYSAQDSTDEERAAAQNVLNIIGTMRAGNGSFTTGTTDVLLNAPKNYTGSNLSYLITFNSGTNGTELFSLVVTVKPETDTLSGAYNQLLEAETAAEEEASRASKEAEQNTLESTSEETTAETP